MIVKELIAQLQELPEELDVIDTNYLLIDGAKITEYTYGDSASPNARTEKAVVIYWAEVIWIFYIQDFIDDYNKDKNFKECRAEEVISEFISSAFRAIDDDLAQLQNDVDSGRCSNQDIFDQIQEIRKRL